jgi:acetyl esterase
MPLDPQAQALLDQMAATEAPPLNTMTPEGARQMMAQMASMGGPPEPVARVEDRTSPDRPARSRSASTHPRASTSRCWSSTMAAAL